MPDKPILYPSERNLLAHYAAHPEYFTPLDSLKNVKKIVRLARIRPGGSILDLGCGDGRIAKILASHFGMRLVGVDFCAERLEKAREICRGLDCRFIEADLNFFCQQNDTVYDYALLIEVLEHLEHPEQILDSLRPKIRGKIIGSVPLKCPYEAHLQVYHSRKEVETKLQVTVFWRKHNRVFFQWSADGVYETGRFHSVRQFFSNLLGK